MDSRIFRHPTVCFVYFASVICFSMILINPVCLAISMISSVLTVIIISKSKALGFVLPVLLFSVLISAAVNVLFNHRGATIISYFPDGNPLTFESLMYGAAASIMLLSVICWFHCLNKRFTSEKIIYVFGSVIPSLSLMFSIALGFVPKKLSETDLMNKNFLKSLRISGVYFPQQFRRRLKMPSAFRKA